MPCFFILCINVVRFMPNLAAAIRKLGAYDLILCGEGSSDLFNQQTAVRIAALLGLPCVAFVEKIAFEGETVKATRKLADTTEVATVKGPLLVSVPGTINHPRIPSLKQVKVDLRGF